MSPFFPRNVTLVDSPTEGGLTDLKLSPSPTPISDWLTGGGRNTIAQYTPKRFIKFAVMALLGFGACERISEIPTQVNARESTPPPPLESRDGVALEAFPDLPNFIKPIDIDQPPGPLPWEASDDALILAVRESGGVVAINFKTPSQSTFRSARKVHGLTKQEALSGRQAVEALGVNITSTLHNTAIVIGTIDPKIAPTIRDHPLVNYVEPMGYARIQGPSTGSAIPPYLRRSTALTSGQDTTWGVLDANPIPVWNEGLKGQGQHITIIDSGVDLDHALNGGLGDANGFNSLTSDFSCVYFSAINSDCWDRASIPISGSFVGIGHGSLTHSIAVGADNTYGYLGLANRISSNSMVKVCSQNNPNTLVCPVFYVASALCWTETNDFVPQVINISIGFNDYSPTLADCVARSHAAGNVIVASTGNFQPGVGGPPQNEILYPARLSQVIAVTGITENHVLANGVASPPCADGLTPGAPPAGARFGSGTELAAGFTAWGMGYPFRYVSSCGTSFAAPVVTAAAAIVWQKYPFLTNEGVRLTLQLNARDLGPTGYDTQYGWGAVDVCRSTGAWNRCTPQPISFLLEGPSDLEVDQSGTWSVSNITGGTGPYTYQWYRDNTPVGASSPSYSTAFSDPFDHYIRVTVTPSSGLLNSQTLPVWVSGGCPPGEEWCDLNEPAGT